MWGTRHGKGKITYADGSFYRGDFKQEQMWGKGVYISKEGAQYEGDWVNNMRHGMGTLMSSDGNIYQGEFWSNMKQGKGFEIRVDEVPRANPDVLAVRGLGQVEEPG